MYEDTKSIYYLTLLPDSTIRISAHFLQHEENLIKIQQIKTLLMSREVENEITDLLIVNSLLIVV